MPANMAGINRSGAQPQRYAADDGQSGRNEHEHGDDRERGQPGQPEHSGGAFADDLAPAPGLAEHGVHGSALSQVEDRSQRSEHGGDDAAGECGQHRFGVHDLLRADREGGGQVGGNMVEERAREHVSQRQPRQRGEHARHRGLEAEQQQHLTPVVALDAQIGDEAPALRDGEQHCVQRQQEAHHHADRGEQLGGLAVGTRRLAQQSQLVVGGGDVEPIRGESAQVPLRATRSAPAAGSTSSWVTRPGRPARR